MRGHWHPGWERRRQPQTGHGCSQRGFTVAETWRCWPDARGEGVFQGGGRVTKAWGRDLASILATQGAFRNPAPVASPSFSKALQDPRLASRPNTHPQSCLPCLLCSRGCKDQFPLLASVVAVRAGEGGGVRGRGKWAPELGGDTEVWDIHSVFYNLPVPCCIILLVNPDPEKRVGVQHRMGCVWTLGSQVIAGSSLDSEELPQIYTRCFCNQDIFLKLKCR